LHASPPQNLSEKEITTKENLCITLKCGIDALECSFEKAVAIIMLMVLSIYSQLIRRMNFLILHDSFKNTTSLEGRTTSGKVRHWLGTSPLRVISIKICAPKEQKKAPTASPWQEGSHSESDGSEVAELDFS
jgi:hypothetical protein